jgi:2-phosphosulfolactate phosphatase
MEFCIYKGHRFPEAKGVCVVIDVLRAFTTSAFAFSAGAKEIVLVSTPEEAFLQHQQDSTLLLMGESEGLRIDGFHFENSPSEMSNANLIGRKMVLRSSSGTQGVIGCSHASHILLTSFVVAEATIKRILELKPSFVSFIATGRTNGDEDVALAEYLISRLEGKTVNRENFLNRVRTCLAAQRMQKGPIAYANGLKDLELALKIDHFPFAMEVFKENGDLIGRTVYSNSANV